MKTPAKPCSSPFLAWAASLPLALGFPLICWALGIVIGSLISNSRPSSDILSLFGASVGFALIFALYSIPVHLISYLVTGLPIFIINYKKPHSIIWKAAVAIPLGIILGTASFLIPVLIDFTKEPRAFRADDFYCLIGAGYGLITAIAAFRQRPHLLEK